jgi:hypothetical protein
MRRTLVQADRVRRSVASGAMLLRVPANAASFDDGFDHDIGPILSSSIATAAWNIASVSRPVFVFSRDT